MPFYEYQCAKCGHEEEVLQKISDKPLKKCSECGKSAMKKQVSAAAFRLKGGGWYETDFKSGDKKNVAGDAQSDNKADKKDKKADKEAGKKTDKKAGGSKTGEFKKSTDKKSSGDSTKSKKIKKSSS